jgi:hypothetical protein
MGLVSFGCAVLLFLAAALCGWSAATAARMERRPELRDQLPAWRATLERRLMGRRANAVSLWWACVEFVLLGFGATLNGLSARVDGWGWLAGPAALSILLGVIAGIVALRRRMRHPVG